ncbi:transcriptional regulator domain-containing protein [Bradyrhizobium sacchari]|uniref:transcriptional regulator domain-containing protein n=1 Tax=Bradyrhizobium sacchari TaxID=1399419 RepID=UPI0009AFF267|nr:DUF6499 domain-containing protein [Bradyrhizobium sacchari]
MPGLDWRSSDAYDRAVDAEGAALAWECLRRNADFRRDQQDLPSTSFSVTPVFRKRWGLVFRS